MSNIGVSINMDKSIISQKGFSQIEFAKRQFLDCEEISGIKYTALDSASKSIKLLPDLFRLMNLRGYSPSPDQFVPARHLSDKAKMYATVMLNEAGFAVRPFGVTLSESFLTDLRRNVFKLRLSSLAEQRDRIFEYLSGNKPVKEFFDSAAICIDQRQIDPDGGQFSETNLHPIVWELNHRGELVMNQLELLWTIDPEDDCVLPGALPVEYIPLLDNSVYFGDKINLKSK